jgi:hypothetical protein
MSVREAAGMDEWLTDHAAKNRLYPDDVFFREALADYRRLAPTARRELEHVAFLLLKPETIVRRSGARVLSFLHEHGYDVIGGRELYVSRHASRDLWRYQFNAAPLGVMRALDILFAAAPAICLAVADEGASRDRPAAARLAAHKGSYIRGIPTDSLRGILGSPTLVLNFVHAPDDPADVLRELGVLIGQPDRSDFLAMLLGCRPATRHETTEAVLGAAHERHPPGEIDSAAALARIEAAARTAREHATVAEIADALRRPLHDDDRLALLLDWLAAGPDGASHWDRAVVAAFLVGHQRLTRPPLVGPPLDGPSLNGPPVDGPSLNGPPATATGNPRTDR